MADLITVQEYKNAEGMTGNKDDQRLAVIVPQVSDLVKNYFGTSFIDYYSTDKIEYFNIEDNTTNTVILSECPVTTIDEVAERTSYSGSYTALTTADYEYYFDSTADAIIRTNKEGTRRSFPKGMGAVKVTYNAGYSATPNDLKLAIFDLVNYYLRNEHKTQRTLAGATMQQQGSATLRGSTDFPDHIKRVLDLYRVVI
jgi:hypothetical protein